MPTPKKGPRLGGSPAHQKAILANLATNLFEHGRITTTEAKARVLRPYAEKLITKAKRGDLHNRRQVMSVIRDKSVVHVLFTEIGPRYAERPGGYTRITKVGPRKGDNAPMAVIELVEEEFTAKARATKKSAAKKATTAPEPVAEESTDATEAGDAVDAPETEQVEAQEAVAAQEPEDETVEEADETDDAEPTDTDDAEPADSSDDTADESTEDESK